MIRNILSHAFAHICLMSRLLFLREQCQSLGEAVAHLNLSVALLWPATRVGQEGVGGRRHLEHLLKDLRDV